MSEPVSSSAVRVGAVRGRYFGENVAQDAIDPSADRARAGHQRDSFRLTANLRPVLDAGVFVDPASHAFREELTLCRETVVRPQAFEGLRGLAAIAVVNGDDRRAATLVGAADAHRYDIRLEAAFFEPARTRCGTDAWIAAAREGSALSFEDAIAHALEEPPM